MVAFDIGFGLARDICTPSYPRFCERNSSHDLGLLVMGFGVILFLVGLILIAVGGSAIFWVEP